MSALNTLPADLDYGSATPPQRKGERTLSASEAMADALTRHLVAKEGMEAGDKGQASRIAHTVAQRVYSSLVLGPWHFYPVPIVCGGFHNAACLADGRLSYQNENDAVRARIHEVFERCCCDIADLKTLAAPKFAAAMAALIGGYTAAGFTVNRKGITCRTCQERIAADQANYEAVVAPLAMGRTLRVMAGNAASTAAYLAAKERN